MTNRSDVADDISQDVFLAAYNGLYAFRGDCSVKSWLLTITRNKALHYLQSAFIRKVTLTNKLMNLGTSPAAEQVVFDRLDNRAVWNAVASQIQRGIGARFSLRSEAKRNRHLVESIRRYG
jgi:RNA polymerase sigma-70 factor (ECF subfamily)